MKLESRGVEVGGKGGGGGGVLFVLTAIDFSSLPLPKGMSVCLSVCPSVRPSVCLPTCLSVRLSVCLSLPLWLCLSVCLSVCLPLSLSLPSPPPPPRTHTLWNISVLTVTDHSQLTMQSTAVMTPFTTQCAWFTTGW